MENYLSIGSYSISSDGVSINYVAPSVLPKEMMEKISLSQDDNESSTPINDINAFDKSLKGLLSVPKPH